MEASRGLESNGSYEFLVDGCAPRLDSPVLFKSTASIPTPGWIGSTQYADVLKLQSRHSSPPAVGRKRTTVEGANFFLLDKNVPFWQGRYRLFTTLRMAAMQERATTNTGYARVSTEEQHFDLQMAALSAANCDPIFQDDGISAIAKSRPGFESRKATCSGNTCSP